MCLIIRSLGQPQSVLALHQPILPSQTPQIKAESNSLRLLIPETNSSRIWFLSSYRVRTVISIEGIEATVLVILGLSSLIPMQFSRRQERLGVLQQLIDQDTLHLTTIMQLNASEIPLLWRLQAIDIIVGGESFLAG